MHPVGVLVREEVRRGDGNLRDPVGAGLHPLRYHAVRPGLPIVLKIAVDGLYPEDGIGDRLLTVRVDLIKGQLRLLQVFKNDFLLVAAVEGDRLGGPRQLPHNRAVRP